MNNQINQQNEDELSQHLGALRRMQPTAPAHLAPKILANLPEPTAVDRFTLWLTTAVWRPALAAAVLLMLGFVAGVYGSNPYVEDVTSWYAAEDLVYAATIEEYDYDEI